VASIILPVIAKQGVIDWRCVQGQTTGASATWRGSLTNN
jgi:hypothetical protein